jgi:hypothetical protein
MRERNMAGKKKAASIRCPSAAEKRRVDAMLRRRLPWAFAFDERLHQLALDHPKIKPAKVEAILVSPWAGGPLGALLELEKVRSTLRQRRKDLRHALGISREIGEADIKVLIQEEARLLTEVHEGSLLRKQKWTQPPGPRFWKNTPADLPAGERWLNPRHWPWLRQRAAQLAEYLTPALANPKRPWRHDTRGVGRIGPGCYSKAVRETTAELIVLFYHAPYFPRLVFTATDVKRSLDTYRTTKRA